MYNRYIPNGAAYTRVTEPDSPPASRRSSPPPEQPPPVSDGEKKPSGLAGLLKRLKLEDLDAGDVLLLLIILLIFLDGEDIELVITLGLLLLLGLD